MFPDLATLQAVFPGGALEVTLLIAIVTQTGALFYWAGSMRATQKVQGDEIKALRAAKQLTRTEVGKLMGGQEVLLTHIDNVQERVQRLEREVQRADNKGG